MRASVRVVRRIGKGSLCFLETEKKKKKTKKKRFAFTREVSSVSSCLDTSCEVITKKINVCVIIVVDTFQ